MRNLVLSVIGDDRPGLVSALADAVAGNGGNWERSQLTQLAGKFAGIVVVAVPAEREDGLVAAVTGLDGLLEVAVHSGGGGASQDDEWSAMRIELLGTDRAGIVHELSTALSRSGVTIEKLTTGTRDAPMAGGTLFEATIEVRVPPSAELAEIRADLERIAAELLVDLEFDTE
ncbi:amino acid-binding ACT protein [Gordonia sp. HY002]|uniref:glycine cleavage system protein R n=1 Tax=Gordonia zhenghanii TaxID=2911516 RepID=UPI001EF09A5B|nr:ACT domain-containing protein [Gordonia zhenghanii]MCF8569224.1 amino acid-binding ACT protein [Gordonia zhenghanii]MCF8603544.1 amino acid-binding ACT protein [Gordonia zhenghanii]